MMTLSALGAITHQDLEDGVLLDYMRSRNAPENRSERYGSFEIDELCERESLSLFRFKKNHIEKLKELLNIPDVITTLQRYKVSGKLNFTIEYKTMTYGRQYETPPTHSAIYGR